MTTRVKKPNPRPSDPIGVFDSGMGGLSILSHLRRVLPRERFIFLADQLHVPYGAKTGAQLTDLTGRITRFMLERNTKLIVVACNTATCYAINHLRAHFPVSFIGTVPAVKPACEQSRSRTVAVLSTPATARSAALRDLVRSFADRCRVLRIGCAGLEEAVERGRLDTPETLHLLERYVTRARKSGADRIVLGCTHYPFLKTRIRRIAGAPTIDSGAAVARQTRAVLSRSGLKRQTGTGAVTYWTTGDAREFSRVASALLRDKVSARKAKI